jgi:hypothetical protein
MTFPHAHLLQSCKSSAQWGVQSSVFGPLDKAFAARREKRDYYLS